MQRLRITFAKTAAMRYTGHLDLHKTWERTLRRARLPLAYSEGFSPHPRIQIAAALPLGFTSESEVVDVWMETPQELAAARAAIETAAPPGVRILELAETPERGPALQTQVIAAEYLIEAASDTPAEEMEARIAGLLAAADIPRVRRGKPYDLRPLIESLERLSSDALGHTLLTRLAAREGATGRPEEVVEALGESPAQASFHRRKLFFKPAE